MKWFITTLFLVLNSAFIFAADIAVLTMAVGNDYREAVQAGIENKREYCERHGYDFIYAEQTLDSDRPIEWSKIALVDQTMRNSSYKWIFWTDADSLIMNPSIALEDLIDDQHCLFISKDADKIGSGEFIIKCNAWSIQFLKTVYAHSELVNDPQGVKNAFTMELLKPNWISFTKFIPARLINSFPPDNSGRNSQQIYQSGDFIIHFSGIKDLKFLRSSMDYYAQQVLKEDNNAFNLSYYLGVYSLKLSSLHSYVNEGYMTESQRAQFNKYLPSYTDVKKVVEIGFNAGHSSENFYSNLKNLEKLVAFDINLHPYTKIGAEFMHRKYKERFEFVPGDSLVVVPTYAKESIEKFDLIYVDAKHTYNNCLNDIINASPLAHKGTILWVDDYGGEVKDAVSECVKRGIITIDFFEHSYDPVGGGRGWVQCRYL